MTGRSRCCGPCRRPPPATRQRPPAGAGTRPTGAQRSCAAWDWCLAAGRLTGWSMPSGRSPAPRCSPSWCWIGAGRCKATSGGWSTRSERCWGAGDRDGIQGRGRGRLVWPYGRHRRHGLPACGRGEPAGDVAAVGFDLNPISHPLILLHQGATGATLWHWAMMLDILGYYLLIVPLILALRSWLRPSSPNWIDLAVLYLLAYGGIGAIGGAILATAIPPLIRGYAMAGPAVAAVTGVVGDGDLAPGGHLSEGGPQRRVRLIRATLGGSVPPVDAVGAFPRLIPQSGLVDRGVVPQRPRRHAVSVPGQQVRDLLLCQPGEGARVREPGVAAKQVPMGGPDPGHLTAPGSAGHQEVTVMGGVVREQRIIEPADHDGLGVDEDNRRVRFPPAGQVTHQRHIGPAPGLAHRGGGIPGALAAAAAVPVTLAHDQHVRPPATVAGHPYQPGVVVAARHVIR